MSISSKRFAKTMVLAIAGAFACGAMSTQALAAGVGDKVQYWTAASGTVGVRWNRELAADLGLVLARPVGAKAT